MHLTLKKEATRPPGRNINILQQQMRFDAFVSEFNTERPHEALPMKVPADVYEASPRPPEGLPVISYPFHDRIVTNCGRLCIHRKKVNISTVMAGQRLGLEEVVLRIRAILRRSRGEAQAGADAGVLRYADLELDEDAHEVRRAGRRIDLSPTEFNLLRYLLTNAGKVVSKAQILDRVWHYDFGGDGRIVESYVYYLRRKIDNVDPPLIHTIRGVGYALRAPRGDGG